MEKMATRLVSVHLSGVHGENPADEFVIEWIACCVNLRSISIFVTSNCLENEEVVRLVEEISASGKLRELGIEGYALNFNALIPIIRNNHSLTYMNINAKRSSEGLVKTIDLMAHIPTLQRVYLGLGMSTMAEFGKASHLISKLNHNLVRLRMAMDTRNGIPDNIQDLSNTILSCTSLERLDIYSALKEDIL